MSSGNVEWEAGFVEWESFCFILFYFVLSLSQRFYEGPPTLRGFDRFDYCFFSLKNGRPTIFRLYYLLPDSLCESGPNHGHRSHT